MFAKTLSDPLGKLMAKLETARPAKNDLGYKVWLTQTTAAAELRHYRDPLAFYTVAIARSPRSAMCYNNRADYYANEKKNYGAALQDFTKALELYPGYTTAITNRGVTYMMLGRYQQALADIDAALSVNAIDADNIFRRGELRYVLKDYTRALSDFDQVLTSNQLYPRIYSARAGCLAMLGRGNEAGHDEHAQYRIAARYGQHGEPQ